MTDFVTLGKGVRSNPWPITNIQDYLDSIGGLKISTFVYLNMVYHVMMLDEFRQKLCTFISP